MFWALGDYTEDELNASVSSAVKWSLSPNTAVRISSITHVQSSAQRPHGRTLLNSFYLSSEEINLL